MYKIVIADDHKVVSAAMQKLLESFDKCHVLYTAANGRELLDKFKIPRNIPDLVLLDISMPILDGFQTMKILNEEYPHVKVLGLSMAETEESFLKLIELGAHGFFSKMGPKEGLEEAIHTVMQKGHFYSDEVTQALFRLLKDKNNKQKKQLTEQERKLLSYIGTELTYNEIAAKMNVSPKTIDNYRDSLFRKTGVRSRTTLAIYAFANGYFTP